MPLTREKKEQIVENISELLKSSKMTVIAKYQGTSVKNMQLLRQQAKKSATTVKVVKNRLVIQAIKGNEQLKNIDISHLEGMLAYAFNNEDEVAPAQNLAEFAKTNPQIEFIGAITPTGVWIDADEVKALSILPSKPILIGSVITLLMSPIGNVLSASSNGLGGIVASLQAKTT